jgi:hypothetical protein
MNDDIDVDEPDAEHAQQDELIRAYLLAQAVEWWEYEAKYGWMRDRPVKARGSGAEN